MIDQLAARKVELQIRLQAMQMMNVNGRTLQELTEMEMDRIKAQKELYEIQGRIDNYIKDQPYRSAIA